MIESYGLLHPWLGILIALGVIAGTITLCLFIIEAAYRLINWAHNREVKGKDKKDD